MLEAPEERYGSEYGETRRGTSSSSRRLRRDLSEDFAEPYEDEAPVGRRGAGVKVRFRGLPTTMWGKDCRGLWLARLSGSGGCCVFDGEGIFAA